MKPITIMLSVLISSTLLISCAPKKQSDPAMKALEAQIQRFVPVNISGDTARLSAGDRKALTVLVEATKVVDSLYRKQVWLGNEALLARLAADTSAMGKLRLQYFQINQGPWSKLDHNAPFVDGVPALPPPGANYYPVDMTKDEFSTWVASLPEATQKHATGFFSTIRRDQAGKLSIVPYSVEYAPLLAQLSGKLREAAGLTDNPSLRAFLSARAEALLNDDYYASDVAWMKLDSPIDVTIGPYEVYLDDMFNYKAAFEAYITLRNDEETAKLAKFSSVLQEIEDHLPIDAKYRNPKLGALAPIRVVDEVAIGGEARAGVQTAAFNLPNDERITSAMGSKRVMLKNVQEAKFNAILSRIAAVVLAPDQRGKLAFEPFFTHILAHELMHGLGPHNIVVDGKKTTVRQSMRELGSALEEAKADISALYALQYLIDKGVVEKSTEEQMYVTYLAGVFRSVRFGINEAHGKGMALQFNYLTDKGAFTFDSTAGTFAVNFAKVKDAVRELTAEIMTIQAEGNYARAHQLLETNAVMRPPMRLALERLKDIPVDIAPEFPLVGLK
jgi:hypothetical protein